MNRAHRILAAGAAALGLAAAAADLNSDIDPAELAAEIHGELDHISAPELASRIMDADPNLRIIDLREEAEYRSLHIPGAEHSTMENLARQTFPRSATIVLYSEGGAHSAQAWVLLRLRGYRNVFYLREGIYEWLGRVLEPRLAVDATDAERAEFEKAAEQSRFFGGQPRAEVPRGEVPTGYWTTEEPSVSPATATRDAIAKIRRRGC